MSQPARSTKAAVSKHAELVAASKPAKRGAVATPRPAAPPVAPATALGQNGMVRAGTYPLTAGKTVFFDPRVPEVEIFFEMVTPEIAELYLQHRPNRQRTQSPKTIDRYAGDLASEDWPFTADPIRFNSLGEQVDGQHRCKAIIKANMPMLSVVVVGLDPETVVVFDTGRPRTFADHLQMMGVANAAAVASVTRRAHDWRRGNYGVAGVGRIPYPLYLNAPASTSKLLETFNTMSDEIQNSTRRGIAIKSGFANKTASASVLALVHLVLGRLDVEWREQFFHQLVHGPEQNNAIYPLYVLREKLKKRVPVSQRGLPDWVWIHFLFLTFNKWFSAQTMTSNSLSAPSKAGYGHVALPIDPHADEREPGWEPLGGVTE